MKKYSVAFLAGVLLIGFAPAYAGEPVQFYRIVSTQATRITSFNSDGTLSFSNSVSNAICRIERSSSTSASSWYNRKPVIWVRGTNRTNTVAIPAVATNEFTLQGTVEYQTIEGGFFGIIGPLGEAYDPINLPSWLAVDGMTITNYKVRICDNQISYHMWGTLIEFIPEAWWWWYIE